LSIAIVAGSTAPAASGQSEAALVGDLVAKVSAAQARVDAQNLGLGQLQESVNQALVDLHDAQTRAQQARLGVEEARLRLERAQEDVEKLRGELDEITRAQYRGASADALGALAGTGSQRDVLDRAGFLNKRSGEKQTKLHEAERARAEAANEAAVLKEASAAADAAEEAASAAESHAREVLGENQAELAASVAERDAAQAELDAAQRVLDAQRAEQAPEQALEQAQGDAQGEPGATAAVVPYAAQRFDRGAVEVSPEVVLEVARHVAEIAPDAPAPDGDAVKDAVVTAVQMSSDSGVLDAAASQITIPEIDRETALQAAAIAAGVLLVGAVATRHVSFEDPFAGGAESRRELVTAFADGVSGALGGGASDAVARPSEKLAEVMPDVTDSAKYSDTVRNVVSKASNASQIELVIARAESAIGTPYVWGGGDANGPTTGLNGGTQAGFDCSGLVLYAYAAAGISLPHYTGYQYQRGTHVPASEAKRGDLLFWGPGGSQHVAIYLGNGMMIEAPQSGQNVTIAPVRWSGMTPNAVRLL